LNVGGGKRGGIIVGGLTIAFCQNIPYTRGIQNAGWAPRIVLDFLPEVADMGFLGIFHSRIMFPPDLSCQSGVCNQLAGVFHQHVHDTSFDIRQVNQSITLI
jgi:hypothetical protein